MLLWLAQIPLAWSLARRLRRGHREREALLRRAIDASDLERRRIASDLHDGVVQSLAGLSCSLAAAAEGLPAGSPAREAVESGAVETRRTVRELRTLLVEIYPPALRRAGLEAALSDLLSGSFRNGLEAPLNVEPGLELPAEAEALVYRAAQEAVRNVRAHADARSVAVDVRREDGRALLEVADDGRGFDQGEGPPGEEGHFGLRVLDDLARDAGGSFDVSSRPGAGTHVRLEVPLR